MKSDKNELIKRDIHSWFKTALQFLLPVVLIYIVFVQSNMQDGFGWSDFIPNTFVQGAMVAYILNEILALIKKYLESTKY